MKRTFLFALSALLLATSCNESNGSAEGGPDAYYFATVMKIGVSLTDDDDSDSDSDSDADDTLPTDLYFQLDNEETFIITQNASTVDLDNLSAGDRVIVGVTISEFVDDSYDYAAKLYDVVPVITGENMTVKTEAESDDIVDDQIAAVATNMTLTYGYLNILAGAQSNNVSDIKFYLVDNQFQDPDETKAGYLNLELRFDNASKEGSTITYLYEKYVSFNMAEYKDVLEGMDGIMLRINTEGSGIVTVPIESKNLFSEDE